MTMHLTLVTPKATVLDIETTRIVGEAQDGAFGLLPRHAGFATALRPGILAYTLPDGTERFAGTDTGTLVKAGREVRVAVRAAIVGDDLETLHHQVTAAFVDLDEHERTARAALARLEASMIRRFIDLERPPA
ncbi:ATPase [Futiania mangrovi]|uniref:ATP synthase epsilon chain n=1 Tax=Futiania mangrovi TaxID=2959716 RepID=A0A9J6PFA6_9PROT|nr:ATPase [Futiania mangrovii]MCP1335303.1 ATPase [Futiania mangrovii]